MFYGACLKSLMLCAPFDTAPLFLLCVFSIRNPELIHTSLNPEQFLSLVSCPMSWLGIVLFQFISFHFFPHSRSVPVLCLRFSFYSFICKTCQKQLPWWVSGHLLDQNTRIGISAVLLQFTHFDLWIYLFATIGFLLMHQFSVVFIRFDSWHVCICIRSDLTDGCWQSFCMVQQNLDIIWSLYCQ